MTPEQIHHFQTLGFIQCKQLLSPEETATISSAFDAAMETARKGAPIPKAGEKRQQVNPFFDYHPDGLYPLLDNERIVDIFENVMGEDFIFTESEGIIHTSGTRWHKDSTAPDGIFSMRAAIYLDTLGPDDGCLNVIPGSHFTEFREALMETIGELGVGPEDVPGLYPLTNEPGDVIFMNHKMVHSALGGEAGRRAIHINCAQNTTPEKNQEHFDWLIRLLEDATREYGRFYSDRLVATAGPRRRKMLQRAIELGFGTKGAITQMQDLR